MRAKPENVLSRYSQVIEQWLILFQLIKITEVGIVADEVKVAAQFHVEACMKNTGENVAAVFFFKTLRLVEIKTAACIKQKRWSAVYIFKSHFRIAQVFFTYKTPERHINIIIPAVKAG